MKPNDLRRAVLVLLPLLMLAGCSWLQQALRPAGGLLAPGAARSRKLLASRKFHRSASRRAPGD